MLALVQEDFTAMEDSPKEDAPELTLDEKILEAAKTGNESLVRKLLEIKSENDSSLLFPTETDWERQINVWANEEVRKLGFIPNSLRFKVFVHGSEDERKWVVMDGVTVHIHYYGKAADTREICKDINGREYSPFWRSFRNVLNKVPKLQRSTAIEVRNVMLTRSLEYTPDWKKTICHDVEKTFDLLHDRNTNTSVLVTVTKSHKRSGMSVTVSGDINELHSLEREALVLLSRKVFESDNS